MSWFEHGPSRIYYEESGHGDPVLLLPGFSDSIAKYSTLRAALAGRYRVIAADLPGSGRSGPQPRQYSSRFYDEDASSFVALLDEIRCGPTHLLGFSDGGEDALLMAALDPAMTRSVVAWGVAGAVIDPSGQIVAAFRDVVDNPIPQMKDYRADLIELYGESNARAMTQSFAGALTAIHDAGGDISRSNACAIACPTLLIRGEQDGFISRATLDDLASRIKAAETIEVDGAGHGVHNARPEWFTQTVLDWLARH